VGPSIVTTASNGIFFSGLAALLQGRPTLAGVGICLGALLDFADGMVARRTNRCSRIGFQYDYIMDRIKSAGLFLTMAYLSGPGLLRTSALAAVILLGFREVLSWILPVRRVTDILKRNSWQAAFGRFYRGMDELFRNDPWQLVLLGGMLFYSPTGANFVFAYYLLTLWVDSWVLFRSYVNAGSLRIPTHPHLFFWGTEGRVKTAITRFLRGPA